MSKLATPKPTSAINSDMSHVIDDATSALHDTYDETASMLDSTMPLGEFLDKQLARARENEIRVNYHFALSGVHVLSFSLRCELCSALPLARAHRLVP